MSKLTVTILRADHPNENGRIYPLAALESCVKKYETDGPIIGSFGVSADPVSLSDASHIVDNLRIENGFLVGDVKFLTQQAQQISSMPDITFRPMGYGVIKDNVVTDYQLISIDAVIDGAEL